MRKKYYTPPNFRSVRIGSSQMLTGSEDVAVDPTKEASDENGGWSKQFGGTLVDDDDGTYFY